MVKMETVDAKGAGPSPANWSPVRTTRSFEPELERELLRRGVGHRARSGDRCADCGRAPLIGSGPQPRKFG